MSLSNMNPQSKSSENKKQRDIKSQSAPLLAPLPTFTDSISTLGGLLKDYEEKEAKKRKAPPAKAPKKRKKVKTRTQSHTAITVKIPSSATKGKPDRRASSKKTAPWQTEEIMGLKKDRMQSIHLVPQRDIAEMNGTMFNIYIVSLLCLIWRLLRTLVDQGNQNTNSNTGFWKSDAARLEGCKIVVAFITSSVSSVTSWIPPFGESSELKKFAYQMLKDGTIGFAARMKGQEEKLWLLVRAMRTYLDQRKRVLFENAMKSLTSVLKDVKNDLISRWIHDLPSRDKALEIYFGLLAEKLGIETMLKKFLLKYGAVWNDKMEKMMPGLIEYYAQTLKGVDVREEFMKLYSKSASMNESLMSVDSITESSPGEDTWDFDWGDL